MVFVIGFDSTSLSRLTRWELIISVVGDLVLFESYLGIALSIGQHRDTQVKANPGPQGSVALTLPAAVVQENQPPPPYSEGPEGGEKAVDDKRQSSKLRTLCIPDNGIIKPPAYSLSQMLSKEVKVAEPFSTPVARQGSVTSSPSFQTQTQTETEAQTQTQSQTEAKTLAQAQKETDKGAALYYLIFNLPGAILVFVGLVSQITSSVQADRVNMGQIRSIVIAHSVLLATTVLLTLVRVLRIRRGGPLSDEEYIRRKGNNYIDCILQGAAIASFFIVSSDKWLLASLSGDITGAKHILSEGGMPLVYMLVTKFLALAL